MPLTKNVEQNIKELYADNKKTGRARGANGKPRSREQIIAIAMNAAGRGRKAKTCGPAKGHKIADKACSPKAKQCTSKGYKRVVTSRLPGKYGETDFTNKVIKVNPRKGGLVNTIIHEELHAKHPEMSEKKIYAKADKVERATSVGGQIRLLKKYAPGQSRAPKKMMAKGSWPKTACKRDSAFIKKWKKYM